MEEQRFFLKMISSAVTEYWCSFEIFKGHMARSQREDRANLTGTWPVPAAYSVHTLMGSQIGLMLYCHHLKIFNAIEGFNNRLDEVVARISEFKDRAEEITQPEKQKEKNWKKAKIA